MPFPELHPLAVHITLSRDKMYLQNGITKITAHAGSLQDNDTDSPS